MNHRTELLKIEEKLANIENIMAAGKEMTQIGLKEIENNIETEHDYNREKFWDIMEGIEKMGERKTDAMEEEKAKTESEGRMKSRSQEPEPTT
eukprot:9551580-Heterocapsa_arctica.AAC.1